MSVAEEAWSFVLASNGLDAETIEQFTTQARNHRELQAVLPLRPYRNLSGIPSESAHHCCTGGISSCCRHDP